MSDESPTQCLETATLTLPGDPLGIDAAAPQHSQYVVMIVGLVLFVVFVRVLFTVFPVCAKALGFRSSSDGPNAARSVKAVEKEPERAEPP